MRNMSIAKKRKIKGMTLLEVIIVLGIMGVIAAGVVVLAQRAIDSQNMTKLVQSLNTIQTAMVQSFRGKLNYPISTTAAQAIQLQNALVSMGRVGDSDFQNPFTGDDLEIYSVAASGVANKAFVIQVAGLSHEQCRAIVTGAADLFQYIEVVTETEGASAPPAAGASVSSAADATKSTGVIKSTSSGTQFNVTDLGHITALCGGDAGASGSYSVRFGSR